MLQQCKAASRGGVCVLPVSPVSHSSYSCSRPHPPSCVDRTAAAAAQTAECSATAFLSRRQAQLQPRLHDWFDKWDSLNYDLVKQCTFILNQTSETDFFAKKKKKELLLLEAQLSSYHNKGPSQWIFFPLYASFRNHSTLINPLTRCLTYRNS